jgi:hypothetical protein
VGEAAISSTGSRAPLVYRTCEITTSRVRGPIAASNAAMIASSSPPSPTSTTSIEAPVRAAAAKTGPRPPGVLGRGRHDPVARSQVDRPDGRVHRARRRVGDRDLVDVRADHGGDGAARLGEPLEEAVPVVHRRAADSELVLDDLGHARRPSRRASGRPSRC